MVRHRVNCDGLPQYHLRRIGRRPSLPKVINFINFNKRVTLIGRNSEVVDYVLSSANELRKRTISRTHARVIRSPSSNQHRLVDSSFTGVYVNDRRLDGDVILSEGDTVTFGHPQNSRVDRGGRVRQPNSEFHFMFELCDCEQGQGTEQGQEPRPCTAPPVQPPLVLPAACPRLPAPHLLWGALPSFVPGQLWAMGEARARTSDVVALRDLGKSTTVTEVREQLAPASGVVWLPYPWCGPEQMELASRGLASTDPDARSLAAPGVPPQPPVTPTQPSLVNGDSPIIRGSTGGTYLDSHTKECSLFPPVPLALWNGYLNRAAEGAVSGEGESSRRRLPVFEDRLRSGEARQLPSDRWEAPASPSGQDSPAGAKTMTDRRCASVPVSRFHREQNKHTGEACVAAAAFWPTGGVALQGGVSTRTTPCPNVVPGGGSTGTAQDEIQGNSAGSARCREPVAGMEWAPPMNKEPPEDTGAGDVTKATEAAEPPLGHGVTGQFKQHQGDDTLTELTVHDSTFTQEVPTVLGADTGCLSGGSVSSIGEVRGDPALSDWQAGENEFHVDDEGCQSKGGDPVTDSFRSAARWQDGASQPGLGNTGETDTPAPLPQSERWRGAVRNSSEGTFVEGNSASESSFCVQTLEILEDPDKRLEDVCVSRDVPGQHSSLEGRIENGTMVDMESEENGGLHGDPQTLLGNAVCAEDALPIPMDIGLTALNGQSIEAKLDDDHLIEARATEDTITDCTGTAGNGTELSSACEVQLSSDGSYICATVVDELETSNILALRTETSNSLPKDTSSALTKQMGKAGSLINSATREGFGSLVESQVAHKLEAVSVGRSEWIKEGGDGSSFVEAPAAVPDTSWVKCTALDDSVPNADSFTFASETKPESRLALELARDMDSFPITTLSTFGPSVPGVTSRDSKWPVILPGKLCSPLVGPEQGAQDQVSTAGQPTEGDCARAMPGDAVGALGDSETHRKTPRASSKVDVEDTKAQDELNLTDQRELEMDEVQEMETGVSQEMGGQRVDLRCDGKLLPLEGTTCLNVLMESEIATLGRVGLCDTCLVVTNGEESESDAKEASVMLHLSPRADPELAGDSIEKGKDMEVDPVPECAGGNVDVADVNPVAVARNTTSPDVGTVTLSTSLECDVINKPISPEPSAAAGDYMEKQQEVSPPERAEAHSELELTDPLAVPPSLSECVEPDSHGGEGQLPECPALTREEGDEAVGRLIPAGGPIAALVKLGTTVGPEWRTSSYTAGPPPSVASWTGTAPSPPTQTESRSQAATGEPVEQSCSEHLALEQPSHGVPSSVAAGLEGEDLQFPVKPQESENLLRGGEVSDPSHAGVSLVGQKAEANPFSVPEAGEGLNKVDGEPAEERYLVSEYLTTRTVPGATAELGGHREDFTDTGKTELSSNSIEDGGKFHLSKDCGPGVSSQSETCKSEKTEGGERELCSTQWMHHGALGMSDTEDLSSVPSDGCSQAMEPETEGSPLTAVRTVPLGCWTTTKVWQCRVGGLVALRCPGRVLACENIMDTKGEPCSSEGPTVSVGGADAPVPQSATVSKMGASISTWSCPTVSKQATNTPMLQGSTVAKGGTDIPTLEDPTVPEGGTNVTSMWVPTLSEQGANILTSQGPAVAEGGADNTAPQGATVTEGGTDDTAPQGATVTEGGTDDTAPQGPTVTEGGTDDTAPQGATVTEGGTDNTAPQGATVTEGGTDDTAPQGATVTEGGTDDTAPQGATVTEGGTDDTAPQGATVTEGGTDDTAPQGPTEGEANTSTSQDPAAQMVECFGKEALVAAGYRGGNGAEWNRALLGGETLLCEGPLAVTVAETTTAEQRAATGDPEWHGDIVPDEWLLASETQLPLDATLGVELELSGTEERELPPGEAGGCLAAGFTNQLERSVATAEEATRIGVKKSQGSGGSHFPSDCMEMGNSAELVEGRPADPSDLQRADLQEDAARGSSPGAKKDEEKPGDLAPGLSDTVIGHLQYQGRNHLEALAAAGVGRGAASAGMEQAEGEQRGSGHLFDACRPVESNELLARDDSSDVGANGCVLETELHCVCPADPDTREERGVHSPVTSSAVAPASVQEASEVGSTCKALTGGGEKPIPGGSGNQGLVDEGHEETKEPPAPEWRSGPSPSWASVRQEEPLRTPSGSDSQRLELWACTKAVLPLALVKSQALETERKDGWQGESLDEKSKLVTDTAVSVGLGSPCEMGQEAGGGSIESDDSLADFAASWCNGWLLSTQVPDNSKNDVSGSEQGEGLSTRADRIDPITEPNQIVTGLVTSSSTDSAIGAGADLGQILTAEEPNGHSLVAKEVQLDTCPQTEFPKAMSVSVEEPAEDLQFEDQRSEENGDSGPAPVPRESDHHEEQPGFSKEAEVGPRGIAKVGKARELCDVGEFGVEMEMGTGATEGTLGEKGVCVSCQFASQIMKQDTGAIKTPLYHPNLAHNSRDTDKSLQQQLVLENPNEDPLKGCRPPSAEGQPNSGSLGTCVFEQANQEGKVIQHISLSEGKDSLFPEAPVTEVFQGKPTVASVDRGWPDVDLETMEGSQQDLGRNEVETASGINVELGLVADSTDIKLSPGCLSLQLSESKSEEEGIAGSWSSDGSRHLGTRALKRPHASEVADLNSTATGPSKRKCTPQQSGAMGLQTEERIKLSLQSFSKQLKQHRANYIGRMVQQFFAEYRQSWKCRVPKLAVVNRRDEVARIVEEFFKTLSVESKANAVVTSQQSMTSSATSQWSTCSGSELGQGSGEDHESFPLEVSQKREEQLERPCLIGQGLALTHVADGTRLSKTAERSLPICHSSSEISWHDRDVGDLDTFPLPEGSDIAQQSETIQESSRDTTSDLLRCSPHFGQNTGDIQIEGDSATEGFGPSFCFTQDSRVYTEKAEAPSTHEMGPLSLPPCSSIAESPEEPGHDRRSEYQSLTLKGTSYDVGGTEEMACDGRESLLLETPNTPCSSTLVENVKVARTDWRSSSSPAQRTVELAEDGVAAVLYDGRSSSDALAHLSALCQDIHPPNLADSGQMVEELSPLDHSYLDQRCEGMDGLSVVQPSAPGVDGLNAAQLGCSNSKAEPVNVVEPSALDFSNMDRNDNSVESVNVAEPSALDHNNIGCSDNESEPVNVAEPSALDYNPHNCSNNKVEPINVMEPSAPHHRSLYQSDSKIGLSIVELLTPDNIDRDRNDDEVEPINIAEPSALDNNDLGCSDNEIEPVNATESSALDNSDLGLSEDKVEPVNIAEPPILDNNDLGCSDDEIEPVNATESSALDNSDLGLSEDEVEPVNIAGPPICDNNDLGCSDDEIEPVNATESSALDNSDLGLSEDEVEPVNIAGPPICDNNDLGCSDDEIEPVNATESSALDNSDLGLSEDKVEPVNIAGPPILDNNDLGCSDKEAEPVNATESSALDNSDLGLSEDEVEPVNIAGPTILDNNDLGCSDDEIEPVNATESSALDNSDLGLSDDEVEPVNIAEPPILDNNDLGCSDDEIEPVNATESSALDNSDLGLSEDEVEPVNIAEPPILDNNDLGCSDDEIEPVNATELSALDDNDLDQSENEVEPVNIVEPSGLDNDAPGHGDDQIEPVNVERLLLHCNNPTHSNAKIEPVNVAKQSALDRSNLDHSDNGVESVNGAELSALVHNTLTSVTGGKSAAPLGRCTEWQSIPNCLPGAGSCTAPCRAPTDCVDPWQSRGEGSVWELSDSPRPDQTGTVGCMSGRYSGREHQSSLAESLHLPASRLSVLEVKNPLRAASRNVIVEDPAWSETWSQLRLESGLRVGRISSEETPQLETPRDSIAHRGRSDIDWRAHGGFVSGSREALGVAGESLAAGGVSSVPFAEDVKIDRGCAPTDGTDCSSSSTSLPSSLPRARDCSAGPVRNLYQDLRSNSPLLTDPRPVGREQPILQVVEATRLGGRGTKEVGPYSWHSTPSGPNTPACPPPPPADQSLVLSTRRRIGESGARAGDIGCERDGASLSCGNQLKAIKKERGSDREAGDCACGQWSRPTNSLPVSGCPLTTSSAVSCLTEPTAGFAHPSAASHCPTLPLDPVSWGSLEWHPARTPLESPAVGFPALWNATPPHAEVPHPQPTQSPSTQPRVKSTAALPSDPPEQSSPAPSLDQSSRADPCNVRLPRQHLPCGHDDEMSFPLAEAECPQDSKGNLDQVNSQDYTFCRLSPSCLGSDRAGLPPRRGSGSNQAEFHPPQSEWNPARRDVTVGAGCCSEGTGEGPQWSAFPEHQGERSQETCQPSEHEAAFVQQSVEHCWASSDQDIRFQLRECNLLLQYISEALQAEGVAEKHVLEWRQTIKELEEQTVPPLTYVAVVGDTGSGKSSLLNALLDEEGVLPTSAMRACTAVVVEVSHNTSSCHYRADIEFFSEEEWNKELLSLLSDMTDKRGRLKRRRPEPGSEASVAYSRVKAVYGKILPYSELKQLREVTQYLGTTTTISQAQASEFRSKVQRFVDSRNDSSSSRGGEFWPIVKRVRVQVPNSAVLQTGAVLVDLPGIGDSNAARNSVAKEYLKTCDAVWIVANVTRAVDDKTAKETLDESLRRQLLMDGQFGRIAFICTKTDSHNVTEIMSALSMNDECSPLEAEIAKLRDQIEQRQVDRKAWRSELEWIQSSNQNGERAKQLELAIKQLEMELIDLHREKSVKQRELSLNSIRARNFFCKQKIRLNFKRGLQDLKCQARAADTDSDEEQEESDDEDADEDDDDDVHEVYPLLAEGSGPDPHLESQLPVFTVSSTEYLKLRDKLQRDGPPRVFHNIEDTEIPAVQRFVHRITLARRALGTEVVIRKLATFVSHIVNYLTNRRAQSASDQAKVREAVQDCLSRVREIFQQTAEDCSRDIENSFTIIKTHLNVGKKVAMKSCEDTVLRWGSRPPIGFPYATYKATCSRYGTFSSPACGAVDFNEELSRPLLTHLQVVWNKEFSTSVPQHLVRFKAAVLRKLEYFFNDLLQRIRRIEGDIQPINYILCQQLSAVRAKLENFAIMLLHDITARQRIISRILTPAVQAGMMPAYLVCASESGPRCFDRMKSHMEQHSHSQKEQIFTATCRKLTDQLDLLKQEIHSRLKHFLDEICNELLVQFEPLLKPLRIIDEIIPKLDSICKRTTALCERSQIDFTLPKIEENDKEPEPGTFLRTPEELGTPPLQDLEKFLGKVKIMKINQEDVNPIDPIEISLDKVVLKYEVSYNLQEEPIPFQLLSACEFSTGIPFLILTHKTKRKGRGRTDVVVLDEEQTPPVFGQWMQAVADRWHLQLKFRRLEVLQGVQRLQSLQVPIEEEAPFVWPGSSEDSSTSSPCDYADSFPLSRKRGWWEMERPGALPMHQGTPHWERSSQLSTETQTQPPVLKKEKGDWWHSGPSQDWMDRSEPPMLENELCKHPATEDLDSA
ncbi:uncharacterized protein LOC127570897 isoform X2 [Pristis pectinata]|uniref:uncharacterized protein LOC127570897 isoform X2 n=1 Tax=Pristis pectinata TaxID=685728 RepID=UPI00223E1511|nr:uncharacterized protein LOC127570897 isoform X2 [Pristis pectinata]